MFQELQNIKKNNRENGIVDAELGATEMRKTRKTQTDFPKQSPKTLFVKFENGIPVFDESLLSINSE